MCQLVVDLSMVTVLVARRKSSQNLKSLQVFFDCVWKEINDMGTFLHIDLVADNYQGSHPFKEQTRKNRGTGTTDAWKQASKELCNRFP